MHKNVFTLFFSIFTILSLVACDNKSESEKVAEKIENSAKNFRGGQPCGSEVISDYNEYVLECKYMSKEQDARDCRSTAESFLAKYPGINCTASKDSSSSVNDEVVTVTESMIQKVLDTLTSAGF